MLRMQPGPCPTGLTLSPKTPRLVRGRIKDQPGKEGGMVEAEVGTGQIILGWVPSCLSWDLSFHILEVE